MLPSKCLMKPRMPQRGLATTGLARTRPSMLRECSCVSEVCTSTGWHHLTLPRGDFASPSYYSALATSVTLQSILDLLHASLATPAARGPGTFADARRGLQPDAFPPWPQAAPAAPVLRRADRLAPNSPTRRIGCALLSANAPPIGAARAPLPQVGAPDGANFCLKRGYAPRTRGPA
jgi:hypothetical protein